MVYFLMLGLLSCVIYFYAIEFITDNPLGLAHRVGNLFYAISLLFPPVFAIVALSIKVAEGVVWISSSPLAGEISKLALATIAACSGLLIAKLASGHMNRRDREDTVDRLAFQSKGHLHRAEELMEAGHYDLVALEGYRCIESVLQRALLSDNVHISSTRAQSTHPHCGPGRDYPGKPGGHLPRAPHCSKSRSTQSRRGHCQGCIVVSRRYSTHGCVRSSGPKGRKGRGRGRGREVCRSDPRTR